MTFKEVHNLLRNFTSNFGHEVLDNFFGAVVEDYGIWWSFFDQLIKFYFERIEALHVIKFYAY